MLFFLNQEKYLKESIEVPCNSRTKDSLHIFQITHDREREVRNKEKKEQKVKHRKQVARKHCKTGKKLHDTLK